jgi:hypothetical protein
MHKFLTLTFSRTEKVGNYITSGSTGPTLYTTARQVVYQDILSLKSIPINFLHFVHTRI